MSRSPQPCHFSRGWVVLDGFNAGSYPCPSGPHELQTLPAAHRDDRSQQTRYLAGYRPSLASPVFSHCPAVWSQAEPLPFMWPLPYWLQWMLRNESIRVGGFWSLFCELRAWQ